MATNNWESHCMELERELAELRGKVQDLEKRGSDEALLGTRNLCRLGSLCFCKTAGLGKIRLEGRDFIGIEREAEYVEIAEKRIAHYRLPILDDKWIPEVQE